MELPASKDLQVVIANENNRQPMNVGLFGVCVIVKGQLVTAGIACNLQIMGNDRLVKRQWLSFGGHINQRFRVIAQKNLKT